MHPHASLDRSEELELSTIVVGVDGSPPAREALRWASEEARFRGATLRAVSVWTMPSFTGFDTHPADPDALQQEAEQRLEAILAEALEPDDRGRVERVVVEGTPASRLIEQAATADLLVLGSRGLGGFKELLLGSVSHQCAQHAPCPVMIMRSASSAE